MALKRFSKKFLKVTAYVLGGIIALLIAFHFWFVNHAEQLIEELVESRSKGKLKLEVRKFKFNWFSNKMELRNAVFYSTDTLKASTAYRLNVKTIRVQVTKVLPLIFEKKVLFDSLHLIDPDIVVTKLRLKDTTAAGDTSMSIPQEMGKVYNSIQDALQVLQVSRFQLENGKFTLINKTRPADFPVSITNLFLSLDNLEVNTSSLAKKDKIFFSENVIINTHQQNIIFPDRRHRLSFQNFHVNVLNRVAEFDSCTISANKGDSAKAAFSIFFDKILMKNIDFDTLYHSEVIKADSVFCINPRFQLNVDLVKRTDPGKSPPRLDELVQQLTGDMQLAFVSVQNGSFNINTTREGRPSSFTSDNNNFELQGLRIRKAAARPLVVDKFVMAIHNYENFLRDSAYAMQFDSILINNNRISLSNFGYQELENNQPVNNVTMSQFELQGLSWDNLVFDRQLKAQNVVLYHPVINYNFTLSKDKKNIFQTLDAIGDILQLDNLDIADGQVNLFFKNNIRLQLENADISVLGHQLVDAKKPASIRKSITGLNFKKGILKMKDITAELSDVRFDGINQRLIAGNAIIKNKDGTDINASGVSIESMIVDDELQQINLDGVRWEKASLRLSAFTGKNKPNSSGYILKNVAGTNTIVSTGNDKKSFSVKLTNFSADEISSVNGKLYSNGLATTGSDFKWKDSTFLLNIQAFQVADHQPSFFTNVSYVAKNSPNSTDITIPSLSMTPDINNLIDGKIFTDAVSVIKPVIRINLSKSESLTGEKQLFPEAVIDKMVVRQPELYYINTTTKGTSSLEWKQMDNDNFFELDNLEMNKNSKSLSAGQLRFDISNFIYSNSAGRTFDAGKGKINAIITNLKIHQNEIDAWDWQGNIQSLNAENFVLDSIDKKAGNLTIVTAKLNDLAISSSSLLNFRELAKQNTSFNLKEVTGSYHNITDQLNWYNAAYDKRTKYFSTDSIFYRPTKDRDEYIASQPYQSDYTTIKTGSINIGPFDINRYINDTILDLGVIGITNGFLTGFRDKRKELQPGLIKPLPVNILKKIPLHLLADSIILNNARVEYEELNDKTNASGKIIVTELNGHISHVKNFNFENSDSLHIRATGRIQDSILTKLNVRESYADSSGNFLMTVKMSPADIRVLNPVLIPLASVELKSGRIDTLVVQVTGNDDLAYGKIKMIYHDLKVKVYKTKDGKQVPASGFTNFIANLLIKNKNKDNTDGVFFERWKDRSPLNYIVKITMSGISGSVGFKKDRKALRKYKKQIREIKLLPATFN